MPCCERLSGETWDDLMESVDTVMLDCDGVLWRGKNAIEGSPEAITYLRNKGKRVILLTNNSTQSRTSYVEKCKRLGFVIDGKDNIITTAQLAADYLSSLEDFEGKAYLIGSDGLGDELADVKIPFIGIGPDPFTSVNSSSGGLSNIELDPKVKAVVVGFDFDISYVKIMKAASYLQKPDCLFIATNDDAMFPESANPQLVYPGAGSIVAAVTVASGRMPTILGKPHKPIFDFVKRRFNIDPSRTLMVGDNISTDIRLAANFGLRSLMVLSGVSTKGDFEKKEFSSFLPQFYTNRLGDILDF